MKSYFIITLLLLTACEPNRYVATDGMDNSYNARKSVWASCEKDAVHTVGAGGLNSSQAAGSILAGVGGGAIGGVIFGAAIASGDSNESPTRVYADKCMAQKGYVVAHN